MSSLTVGACMLHTAFRFGWACNWLCGPQQSISPGRWKLSPGRSAFVCGQQKDVKGAMFDNVTPVQWTISVIISIGSKSPKKQNSLFYSKTLQAPAEVRKRKAGRDKCRQASASSILCSAITGQPIHFIVAALRLLTLVASFGSPAKTRGSLKNPPTFTLRPGLTRQNVTLQRAAVKGEEAMLPSAISSALASTSASNCEAEHTAVTLQERNAFFSLSFYTK